MSNTLQDEYTQNYKYREEADADKGMDKETIQMSPIASFVRDKWQQAKDDRAVSEEIWLDSYNQWRGKYSAEEEKQLTEQETRNPGSSRIFIKLTKTKVQAAYSQILEIIEAGGKFPISIEHTPVPENVPEYAYIEAPGAPMGTSDSEMEMSEAPEGDVYGFSGDGQQIEAGTTHKSLFDKLLSFKRRGGKLKEGLSPDKTKMPQFSPAQEAAKENEKIMQDQLLEGQVRDSLKRCLFEAVLYGSGVLKGPFNYNKKCSRWVRDPVTKEVAYAPLDQLVPKFQHVSIWNFYPDPNAKIIDDCEFVVQRHLLGRSKIRDLTNMPFFKESAIRRLLKSAPSSRNIETWENVTRDNTKSEINDRYEVLEYWGFIDCEIAEAAGMTLEDYEKDYITDSIQVNIWVCEGEVIRFIINPFLPQVIPYYIVPYEIHPDQLFGIGIAENMKDTQALMNGHMRLAIDNLRLAGNVVLEVNENQMVPGQEMRVYPGKIFRKQGGAPGQSIYGIKFPDTSNSHMMMFDKVRQISDEQTGLPSYSHGSTGVMSTGRTAAGMSMLMGASQLNIKTVIKNVDQYLLERLGENLFAWNMQFNQDKFKVEGDLKVVARGTHSLLQREILTQRLLTFMQVAMSNPITATQFNASQALRDIALSMDLDPEKYINDPAMALLAADILSKVGGMQQTGSAPVGADNADPTNTGGGNIGVPQPSMPGQQQFSGTPRPEEVVA